MKLLFCPHCQDVLKLQSQRRTCACGKSWGLYEDDLNARIGGSAIPLGIGGRSLVDALESRPEEGKGASFAAFVIPVKVPTITDEGTGSSLKFRGRVSRTVEIFESLFSKKSGF